MKNKQIIAIAIIAVITFGFVSKKLISNNSTTEIQNNDARIAAGKKFLKVKSKEKGVKTLKSGLRYKVLTPGIGQYPIRTSKIKAHYHGTLIDGTVFDSSVDRGQPFTAGVTQLIKGWTEALQLMQVGAKWELYIPYNLAYGEKGAGNIIKPYSTLVFQIELLEIISGGSKAVLSKKRHSRF